jgi:hypothetical protein
MPEGGYYTRAEVEVSEKPFNARGRWIVEPAGKRIFLTKSRCRFFKCAAMKGEEPAAFRYCVAGPGPYKYAAMYDRTSLLISRSSDMLFYDYEVFRNDDPGG